MNIHLTLEQHQALFRHGSIKVLDAAGTSVELALRDEDLASSDEHDWQPLEAEQCARCGEVLTGQLPMDLGEARNWTGPCPGEREEL